MFSCNKVNTIVINTVKGKGYLATEIGRNGKVLEKVIGKHDNPKAVSAFFERMGYPSQNITVKSSPDADIFAVHVK